MAAEAVIIELLGNEGDPITVTVADGATIEKGTLLKISDPRTAAASSAASDTFIGIAAAEKVISDGSTTLAAYTHGIFDLTNIPAAGTELYVTAGQFVEISGANLVRHLSGAVTYDGVAKAVGLALETGSANEVIAVLVNR